VCVGNLHRYYPGNSEIVEEMTVLELMEKLRQFDSGLDVVICLKGWTEGSPVTSVDEFRGAPMYTETGKRFMPVRWGRDRAVLIQ